MAVDISAGVSTKIDMMKQLTRLSKDAVIHDSSAIQTKQRSYRRSYFSHTITKEGRKPNPKKLNAIQKIVPPNNKQELQLLLGCVTYLGKFIPNLTAKSFELRKLSSRGNEFQWSEEHTQILQELKQCITNTPTLKYFDHSK